MESVDTDQAGRSVPRLVAVSVPCAAILVLWLFWGRDSATRGRAPEASPSAAADAASQAEPVSAGPPPEPRAAVEASADSPPASENAGEEQGGEQVPGVAQAPARLALPTCPERRPVDSSPCQLAPDVDMNCGYHEGAEDVTCRCKASSSGGTGWECQKEEETSSLTLCPEAAPVAADSCEIAGQICFYGEAETARVCECALEAPQNWTCMTAVQYAARRH
jgi:hypothetical protein